MNSYNALKFALSKITLSESQVARLYGVGKPKVREMIGKTIRASQKGTGNSRISCNAWDVLKPLIDNCMS